ANLAASLDPVLGATPEATPFWAEDPAAAGPPAAEEAEATAGAASENAPDDDELPEQPAATAATMRDTEDTAAALRRRPRLIRMPFGRDRGRGRLRRQVTIRPHAGRGRNRRACRDRGARVDETPDTYATLEACPTTFA
ncbi:MAG TPA: hypothetical protein VN714_22605, partial [Trebonia sp.]|nr:hypothetical protein [Trebonia sp.]